MRLVNYLTEETNIIVKKPSECTPDERKKFVTMVVSGGQNLSSYVKSSFKSLVWVGFAYDDDEIKAVSAIKRGFVQDTFDKAGVGEQAEDYPYEIGFSFTAEDARQQGFNRQIKNELLKKLGGKGVYCTIRSSNKASIEANKKLGFKPLGKPYPGLLGDYTVQLMVLK